MGIRRDNPMPASAGYTGVPRGSGFEPLRLGLQRPFWQEGGPSGFENGTAGAIKPWPYITGFINFLTAGPYGFASTLSAPKPWPYVTAAQSFNPIGFRKVQTFTKKVF